jgi:hypothetical protein
MGGLWGRSTRCSTLLDYAARGFHGDVEYQRELSMWTTVPGESREESEVGVSGDDVVSEGLGAVGLTTSRARIPDGRP